MWRGFFSDLVVREVKQVDGKDRKRAELRRLLRRTVTRDETTRSLIKELRAIYRSSLRCERSFYWEARVRPVHFPLYYLTYIQDGATQRSARVARPCLYPLPDYAPCVWRSVYVCPRFVGTDVGRKCLSWKMVGNLFHGHVLVLHLVMPHVTDDANLVCHCFDTSMEELVKVRVAKGQPEYLPPNVRVQIDGVSSNWGSTLFAHLQHQHRQHILGAHTEVDRNKVGSTHEDIDALFGTAKRKLEKTDCATPYEMVECVKDAFKEYALPLRVLFVDAVFDYNTFYAPHVDKGLRGYGYVRACVWVCTCMHVMNAITKMSACVCLRYSHKTDGYHQLKLSPEFEFGAAFRKYQPDVFTDVAPCVQDLPSQLRPPDDEAFRPCAFGIDSV